MPEEEDEEKEEEEEEEEERRKEEEEEEEEEESAAELERQRVELTRRLRESLLKLPKEDRDLFPLVNVDDDRNKR